MLHCLPPAPAGRGPWYQTRTCFLGSDCHCPGSRVSPGDCICHRPCWGRARQNVQCHPRTTTASVCLSAPLQYPHTHIHPHPLPSLQHSCPPHPAQCLQERGLLCLWARYQLQFGMAGQPAHSQSPECTEMGALGLVLMWTPQAWSRAGINFP